jgi:hypothetical protein
VIGENCFQTNTVFTVFIPLLCNTDCTATMFDTEDEAIACSDDGAVGNT